MADVPSTKRAIGATVAALGDLLVVFIYVAIDAPPLFVMLIGLCEIGLIAAAIGAWAKYVKAYIAYEVERRVSQAVGGAPEEPK